MFVVAPLKTRVEIIDSTRPAFLASPLADARGYGSASSSPLVGQQAHGHSLAVAARFGLASVRATHRFGARIGLSDALVWADVGWARVG